MNYNYNQYGQYPYNYNQQQYQQYQQPQPNYQQPQPQMQQQTRYLPLTFVSGIEGAKAFIVGAGQTVYLRDSDSDTLYIKTADNQGRYEIQTYTLVSANNQPKMNNASFVLTADFNAFKTTLEERLSNLEKSISSNSQKAGE